MHYHKLRYSFEQHGGSGGYDALLNDPDETLNLRDMFLFICTFQVYTQSINFRAQQFELAFSMHACNLEAKLQV